MIKALVCFHDNLLRQPSTTTSSEIQASAFNQFILDKPDQNCLDRAGCLPSNIKNDRLVTQFWLGWFTGITILGIVAPAFAVQSEAKFSGTANTNQPATTRHIEELAVFSASPMLISQAENLLQLGDSGAAVTDLQNRLAALGYYRGTIDGDFGVQTEAAVMQFQQAQGLTPDGIVGPLTDSTLRRSGVASTGLSSGSTVSPTLPQGRFSIVELQRRLQSRGFYQGPIDGVPGPQTRAAIAAAQRAYSVTESDILGGGF